MIVLDTHIWLWWVNLEHARMKPAWLAQHSRIILPCSRDEWFEKALDGSGINLLPITPRIAGLAVELVEHHRDPQDRLIIAMALSYDATLISADTRFPLYTELNGRLLT